jgi:diketogulonate reductase-like aldo/keto reductase
VSSKPGEYVFAVKEKDLLPMDFQSVWEAMEECQKLGLAKSIGVSNFSCKKLENLLATAKIPPAVNQVISYILISSSHSLLFFFFFFSAAI